MVEWNSLEEITRDSVAFTKFMHALLGLYAWEWATSLSFDVSVLVGKRKFKWPMTFYFLNRYCLLAALIGIIVSMNVETEIDCQSLYMFNQIMGNFAIGLSSINLSIRTIAVWKSHYFVIIPLVALILGHWVLLLRTVVLVKAQWVNGACQVTGNDPKLITAVYIYSMIFDFIVMCLTGVKLGFGTRQKSELVKMLYLDGLLYFFIAFTANLVAVIFSVLNLNPVMSIIADVPATTIATIAACRVVRRLNTFVNSQGVDLYTPHSGRSPAQVSSNGGFTSGTVQFSAGTRQETRIQMDVISKTHYDDIERGDSPGEIKASPY